MALSGQRDESVVLEIASFARVPVTGVAELLNEPTSLPPVCRGRRPNCRGRSRELGDPSPSGIGGGPAPQLGQHDGGMTDDVRSSQRGQYEVGQLVLSVSYVDAGVENSELHAPVMVGGCSPA